MSIFGNQLSAAEQLEGFELPGRWKIVTKLQASSTATGGKFSVGYEVENISGQKGFLKALDFSTAFAEENPMLALQQLTAAYNFEKAVLERCNQKGMTRIVRVIDHGTFKVPTKVPYPHVPYLIFEHAKNGDMRNYMDLNSAFDLAWALRTLHNISVALGQLHAQGIAHQDLKPSNILVFNEYSAKIGDFGKAAFKGIAAPHDHETIPGDRAYAAPELLYNAVDPNDWNCRRFGSDIYLLGSVMLFIFCKVNTTSAVLGHLPKNYHPSYWNGLFSEVLPYYRHAFGEVIDQFRKELKFSYEDDIITAFKELCEPDPKRRGHPRNQFGHTNQYSVERYISLFDRLAVRAELKMFNL